MPASTHFPTVSVPRLRRAEAVRHMGQWMAAAWAHWLAARAAARAEAHLRAMDDRELRDLALDRCTIAHAARHGRQEG